MSWYVSTIPKTCRRASSQSQTRLLRWFGRGDRPSIAAPGVPRTSANARTGKMDEGMVEFTVLTTEEFSKEAVWPAIKAVLKAGKPKAATNLATKMAAKLRRP